MDGNIYSILNLVSLTVETHSRLTISLDSSLLLSSVICKFYSIQVSLVKAECKLTQFKVVPYNMNSNKLLYDGQYWMSQEAPSTVVLELWATLPGVSIHDLTLVFISYCNCMFTYCTCRKLQLTRTYSKTPPISCCTELQNLKMSITF